MKVLLLFFVSICFFQSATAQIKWPDGHYTIESLNQKIFSHLNRYFKTIQSTRPIRYTRNGYNIYYKHYDKVAIRASYKIVGNYTYLNYASRNKNFVVKVTNTDHQIASELIDFNYSKIISKNNFEISFQELKMHLNKKTIVDNIQMKYLLRWGMVLLSEDYALDRLESSMWVNCGRCGGERLLFIFRELENSFKKTYFMGELQDETTPKQFYELANSWYLPDITGQADSIIQKLVSKFGWPSER